uniref:Adenylyl cyclase-associated protein n=1 Tax=Gadus morhua TaxID=8049 RepID=A0A8C5CG40_GADMO
MAELASLVQRLEVAVGRLEAASGSAGGPSPPAGGGAMSAYVGAYDDILSGPVAQYMALSKEIGGDVLKHVSQSKNPFLTERFLTLGHLPLLSNQPPPPPQAVLAAMLQPVSKVMEAVQSLRERSRSSPHFNHLSSVSESVPALGWVAVAPKPGPYVKEMQDSAMFYTNRVLKDYKEKDKTHVDWVKAYLSIWTEMQNYIKTHHTTGLVWSKTGPVASACDGPPRAPGGCGPPPPPPGPPPPPMAEPSQGSGGGAAETRNALFAAINKGSDVTTGLKHVSDTEKTHKNPGLRVQAPVRTGPKPFSASPAAAASVSRKLPPVFELDGKKWKVENQAGVPGLVISETELKQVVYTYKCSNTTLTVKGKINSITLDNCHKLGLVFDDVVGIVEVINCRDVKVQVLGKIPTISINKTDGCHVYLSKDSLACEIISAKSSEMNILVPDADGEFTELPVPEQFKTVWDGKKLVTTNTEIAG